MWKLLNPLRDSQEFESDIGYCKYCGCKVDYFDTVCRCCGEEVEE